MLETREGKNHPLDLLRWKIPFNKVFAFEFNYINNLIRRREKKEQLFRRRGKIKKKKWKFNHQMLEAN